MIGNNSFFQLNLNTTCITIEVKESIIIQTLTTLQKCRNYQKFIIYFNLQGGAKVSEIIFKF